ncbi:hypothetical protein [Dokdonia sp.]|uniref:hypothetical protein n=1 Tax=Dokdonia sp. TaxID=2024995 RepID=UPI0032651788
MIPKTLNSALFKTNNYVLDALDANYYDNVRFAVFNRDQHTCHYCKFKASKFQKIVAINGAVTDFDSLITTCIFCQQCFSLNSIKDMGSGILIWLPEFDQIELNQLARILYVNSDYSNDIGEKATYIINQFHERSQECKSVIGTNNIDDLVKLISEKSDDTNFQKQLENVRIFPLNRRIKKEGPIEYNVFPKIVSYWKKIFLDVDDTTIHNELLLRVESLFFTEDGFANYLDNKTIKNEEGLDKNETNNSESSTHANLAGKLLVDAASFFMTLGKENEEIKTEMIENSSVFKHMAALIVNQPNGIINGKSHAELASKLLEDAATFFETLAKENKPIRDQMLENASVFKQIAKLVLLDPNSILA